MKFNEIDETNPLFSVLLHFRKQESKMLEIAESVTQYLMRAKNRHIHIPFLYSNIRHLNTLPKPTVLYDNIIYMAIYDKFAKQFINIRDEKDNIIIDLQVERKKQSGNGAIGMG